MRLPPPIGVPLESQKPISTCGPVEMPTMPGPTELITWPALTWVPIGELVSGSGVPVVDVAAAVERAVAVQHRRPWSEAADPVQDDRAGADRELRRVSRGGDVDAMVEATKYSAETPRPSAAGR